MYQVRVENTVTPHGTQIILAAWRNSGQYTVNCNPFYSTVFLSQSEINSQPCTTYGYEF